MTQLELQARYEIYDAAWREALEDARRAPEHMLAWIEMKQRLAQRFYNLMKEARDGLGQSNH